MSVGNVCPYLQLFEEAPVELVDGVDVAEEGLALRRRQRRSGALGSPVIQVALHKSRKNEMETRPNEKRDKGNNRRIDFRTESIIRGVAFNVEAPEELGLVFSSLICSPCTTTSF